MRPSGLNDVLVLFSTLLLILLGSSCTFDANLDRFNNRVCENDAACDDGFVCIEETCQGPPACTTANDCTDVFAELGECQVAQCSAAGLCVSDTAPPDSVCGEGNGSCAPGRCGADGACRRISDDSLCDNGLFCDGVERCSVADVAADERGCVAGLAVNVEDDVACTQGRCDEATDAVVQDCAACPCCGDGASCADDNNTPPSCFTWTCSPTFACVLDSAAEGAPCDDGASCTRDDACDADQVCQGTPDDGVCADPSYCNGAETCAPNENRADADGCISTPRQIDDGVACSIDKCDEDLQAVLHDTSMCECLVDSDCDTPCAEGNCIDDRCQVELFDAGAPCNDGFACTENTTCTAEGACVGEPNDALCMSDASCPQLALCRPDASTVLTEGCVTLDPELACDNDGLVLWLDGHAEPELEPERQQHDLNGSWLCCGDINITRIESADPESGDYYVYAIPFEGAYTEPLSIVFDDTVVENSFGDTFEVEARNITAQGFDLYVYRTDRVGEAFGKGPDEVRWQTEHAHLVAVWPDQSSSASDGTQSEQDRRPVFDAQSRLLRFRDDWLNFPRPIQNDFTIVMVFRSGDDRSATNWWDCPALVGGELSGTVNDFGLLLCGGQVAWAARDGGFDLVTDVPGEFSDQNLHMVTFTRQRQPEGAVGLRMDGQERASGQGVTESLNSADMLRLARHPTGSGPLNIDYAEVLMFNRVLDADAIVNVEQYMRTKWGL